MKSYYDIPHLQVRHNSIVYYTIPSVRPPTGQREFKKSYSGKVTSSVRRRIQKTVDLLIQKSPKKIIHNPILGIDHPFTLGFVTLTITDNTAITGKEAHRTLLRPFLRKMRSYGKFDYIWKAEFQKRGQLHYHVTWNIWIDYRDIRKHWNKLQLKAGLLKKFGKKYRHYNPNSTDVHSVKKIRDIAAYLGKYLAKKNTKTLDGKVWDCSRSLKFNRYSFIMENENDTRLRQAVDDGLVEMIELERCTVFRTKDPLSILTPLQLKNYQKHIT